MNRKIKFIIAALFAIGISSISYSCKESPKTTRNSKTEKTTDHDSTIVEAIIQSYLRKLLPHRQIVLLNSEKTTLDFTCNFDSLGNVLQELGVCLNIDAKTWEDSIKIDSNLELEWRYFYDTSFFKAYKMSNDLSCQDLFLLEISVNHGSGEYDNYVIKKRGDGYEIVFDFKGYLNKIIITDSNQFKFTYRISVTNEKSCLVNGVFDGKQMITDSVLSNDLLCKKVFIKGQPW